METNTKYNKNAKVFNLLSVLVFIVLVIICAIFHKVYIAFIIGGIYFGALFGIDYFVKYYIKKIDAQNNKVLDANKSNNKVGYLDNKRYMNLVEDKGIVLDDGTPITKRDVKEI